MHSDVMLQCLLGAVQKSFNSYLDELQGMLTLSCGVSSLMYNCLVNIA